MAYSKERVTAFEQFVEKIMQAYEAPGMVVALAEQGEVKYLKAFGTRDLAGLPVTDHTIFGLASVTKSFTALAIMQLAEKGLLSPQDPVTRYLPEFRLPAGYDADTVTIHHLITHTAGFPPLPTLGYSIRGNTVPDEVKPDGEQKQEYPPINTMSELLDFLANGDYRMLGKPDQHLSYSNDCYGLLGEIIARVTGQSYESYVQEHILQPLGMSRSVFTLEELQNFDDVTELYYRNEQDQLKHSSNWQVAPPFTACGWLKSCASDLIRYAAMYAGGGELEGRRLISEAGVRQMLQGTHEFSTHRKYGYGLMVQQDYDGVTLVEHGGSLKGVSSNMGFVPEQGIAAVVLCNLTGVPVAKVWLALINLALGLPIEQSRVEYPEFTWSEDMGGRVVGEYRSGEGATYHIEQEEDGLQIRSMLGSFQLQPTGPDTAIWRHKLNELELRFLFDQSGKAWAIGSGGRVIPRAASKEE